MSSPHPFAAHEGWSRVGAPGVSNGDDSLPALDGEVPMPPLQSDSDVLRAILETLLYGNQLLTAILQELREQAQEGVVINFPDTVAVRAPIREIEFNPPLFSISITCDGPAAFEYRIPNRPAAPWGQINPGEVNVVNFIKARVDSIGVRTLPAGIASTFRVLGSF